MRQASGSARVTTTTPTHLVIEHSLLALFVVTLIRDDHKDSVEFEFDSRWVSFGLIGTFVRVSNHPFRDASS